MMYDLSGRNTLRSACGLALIVLISQNAYTKTTIYGLDRVHHFIGHTKGPFYIQAASFKSLSNANAYVHQLRARTQYPVRLKTLDGFHAVIIGPVASANEVKTILINKKVPSVQNLHKADQKNKPVSITPTRVELKSAPEKEPRIVAERSTSNHLLPHAYIQADLGLSSSRPADSMQIFNGALDPYPANMDLFSINKNHRGGMAAISAGLRWKQERRYIPAYSLGVRYQNFFDQQLDGSITQYFDPEFVNYGYMLKTSSNVFSVFSKINLVQVHRVLPYASFGIGSSINKTGRYTEQAYPGVVARIDSPNFNSLSSTQFSYNLGAGLDFQLNPKMLMFLGYEYQDLGAIRSGDGQFPWSSERLSLNHYRTNTVLVGLSYSPGS